MKRCPECRRDNHDDSLLYCLEDGTALIQGSVAAPDEPETAILRETSPSSDAATQPQIRATDRTTAKSLEFPSASKRSVDKRLIATPLLVALILLGGMAGYRYLKSPAPHQINSIAVLPFQNRSDDADTDYLSDGLAESLIFRLTQLPGLKVSPTSSVMRYKDKDADVSKIASELGVDAVMTGRLLKRGDNLNITVELVDTRDNKSLWGEQYERKMADLLDTQREIASTIVQKLQLTLSGNQNKGITKQYTDNNEAYQLWMKGRYHFSRRTKDDIGKSIDAFQQAVALDPNFALAYVGIAESYAVSPSFPYASPAECLPKAKAAVAKALELDPQLPEAHTVAGMIAATYDWDWATAESEFKRSLELDPNLAITHYRYAWTYLSPLGRHDEAVAEMRKAMELEPLSLIQGSNFAGVLMYARRYDEAIAQAQKTADLDPQFFGAKSWLCHSLIARGRYNDALATAEPTLNTENPFLSDAGLAYALSGQREKALGILERWKEAEKRKYVMNYLVAILYGTLGDKDAAFAQLEKAYQNHDWFLQRIKVDPMADPLRDDPRFNAMLKKLNLPNN